MADRASAAAQAAVALLLAGCGTQPQGPPVEPRVFFPVKDRMVVKEALVREAMDAGYSLAQDGDLALEFSRPATSGESLAAALSVGNSASTNTRELRFTILSEPSGFTVTIEPTLCAVLPFGQKNCRALDNPELIRSWVEPLATRAEELKATPAIDNTAPY